MRHLLVLAILLIISCSQSTHRSNYLQEAETQLSLPDINITKPFFDHSTQIEINNQDQNINIQYTTDNTEPNIRSKVSSNIIDVSDSGIYKFKAFQKGLIPSQTLTIEAIKTRKVNWLNLDFDKPNEKYDPGISVLTDHKKGDWNFRNGEWCGYNDHTVKFSFLLDGNQEIYGIAVSSLIDQDSWIFAPKKVSLTYYYANKEEEYFESFISESKNQVEKKMQYIKIATAPKKPLKIEVTVHNISSIPEWHTGNGYKPWLFIDEILIL